MRPFHWLRLGVVWCGLFLFAAPDCGWSQVTWNEVTPAPSGGPNAPLPLGRVFPATCRGPRATGGPAPLVADDDPDDVSVIFMCGGIKQGWQGTEPAIMSSDLWQFDPAANIWSALPSLPVPMVGHAMVFVPSVGPRGRIFIIGGYQGQAPYAASNRVAIYDVGSGQYLTELGNPDNVNNQARDLFNNAAITARVGHSAAFVPPSVAGAGFPFGIVVVFGGNVDTNADGGPDALTNDTHYIDIATMTWDSVGVTVSGSPPSPRCHSKMWFNGWNNSSPTTTPASTGLTNGVYSDLLTIAPPAGTNITGAFLTTTSRVYLFGGSDAQFDFYISTGGPLPTLIDVTHFSDVFRLGQAAPPNFAWQAVLPSGFGPSPNPRVVYNQLAASPEDLTAIIFGGSHTDLEFYNDVFRLKLGVLGSEQWEIFTANANPPGIRAYGACEVIGPAMYQFFGFFDSDLGTESRLGPEGSNDSPNDWYANIFRMTAVSPPPSGGGGVVGGGGTTPTSSTTTGGGGSSGGGGSGCIVGGLTGASALGILALFTLAAMGAMILISQRVRR